MSAAHMRMRISVYALRFSMPAESNEVSMESRKVDMPAQPPAAHLTRQAAAVFNRFILFQSG